jgi:hypothetical protein
MSRSYRKPYAAITGTSSAKDDKIRAARAVRHVQNLYLRKTLHGDFPDQFLVPHRLECPANEVYAWRRDGKQRLQFPRARHPGDSSWAESTFRYWLKLQRK